VQRVSRTIERVFKASALNIAIQDGGDAGQSVSHVHAHIIPRHGGDLDDRGGGDAIYGMMEGEEGDVGKHQREHEELKRDKSSMPKESGEKRRGCFPAVDADEKRRPRSGEEMEREAEWLRMEMEKDAETV